MARGMDAMLSHGRGGQNAVLMFTDYFSGKPNFVRDDVFGGQHNERVAVWFFQ
jgi:hypothetical protein